MVAPEAIRGLPAANNDTAPLCPIPTANTLPVNRLNSTIP
jgi:hypothetical protein